MENDPCWPPCLATENYLIVKVLVKNMSNLCPGHVKVISIPALSQISRSGAGYDSRIAMSSTITNYHPLNFSELETPQEVNHKHKGWFRVWVSSLTWIWISQNILVVQNIRSSGTTNSWWVKDNLIVKSELIFISVIFCSYELLHKRKD